MKVEIELKNFTPLLDALIQKYGVITAAIYGIVWRYAQMDNRVCNASLEKIGKRLDVSGKTAERHIKKLCADGYLTDLTPSIRNKPHSYAITGKAELSGSIVASPDRKSDQGQTESLTRSDRESDPGQTESPLKIHTKKQTKKDKASSAIADFTLPISLLSEKEVRELKLPLSGWKQYLDDERAERKRTGVISFIEKKLATGPLSPDTPAAHILFDKLAIEAEAKGRRPAQKFPTLAAKEKFGIAAVSLNGTLEAAISKALEAGITSIPKIINYISSPKWRDNNDGQGSTRTRQRQATGQTGGGKGTSGSFAPPAGSGQSAETTRRLHEAFAPKV